MGGWVLFFPGRRFVVFVALMGMLLGLMPSHPALAAGDPSSSSTEPGTQASTPQVGRLVRTIWTDEVGIPRPTALAFDPSRRQFVVGGRGSNETELVRLDRRSKLIGTSVVPGVSPLEAAAFDSGEDELLLFGAGGAVAIRGSDLESSAPAVRSIPEPPSVSAISRAVDPDGRLLYSLAAGGNDLVVTDLSTGRQAGSLTLPGGIDAGQVAFNPSDGRLYVLSSDGNRLAGLDSSGEVAVSYDLSSVGVMSPEGMTFAPSTDSTDAPSIQNLYVADSGTATSMGGITEVSLVQVAAVTATEDYATLVQTIDTSAWSPAAPDPSGVTWFPGVDNLVVVDSEVDETTGAGWHDVNMWRALRTGTVVGTGTFWGSAAPTFGGSVGFSKEPTGVGYDPGSNTLFVSDDSAQGVFVIRPGGDGAFGTSDDAVSFIDTSGPPFNATDTEDPTFDTATGDLFILSGVDSEIYRVDPTDGVFGNGNDSVSHFDISGLGASDWEGLVAAPSRGSLYVGARNPVNGVHKVFEVGLDGSLIRTINISVSAMTHVSGLGLAPATNSSGMDLWVADRAVDNGANSNENDGKVFELSAPNLADPPGNLAPIVDAGPDQTITLPSDVTLSGSVTDDGLPSGSVTQTWSKVTGPGLVTFADANSAATTASFDTEGTYTLELTATDGELSGSDDVIVTVNGPPNSPPTVDPISDVTVAEGETAVVAVSASDPDGDPLTVTVDGLPSFGTFDAATSEMTFSPAVGDAGTYGPVTVTVADGASTDAGAPAFRSAASAIDTSTSGSVLTIPKPAGVQAGDLLVAQVRYRGDLPSMVPPSGWTELATIPSTSNGHQSVYYKVAGSSEPASYSFDQGYAEGRMAGGIGAYVGVDLDNPIDAWAASADGIASLEAPGLDTTVDNTRVLRLWGWRGASAADPGVGFNTAPTGVTERWSEQVGGSGTGKNRVLAGDQVQSTAGSVGTAVASGSASTGENARNAFTVALRPMPVALTDSTSFNVTVTATTTNQVPVAVDDAASTLEGQPVNVDVLANDSDPDGDVLSVTNVSTPSNGSVTLEADGTVTYTPAVGFSGVDSFTYDASDGVASDTATVTITVDPAPNQVPVVADDSASTTKGQAVNVDVLANDSDPDGDVLSVTNLSTPANGSVTLEADRTVTYTPAAGFSGVDSFTYQASDGTDVSNVATVSVTVSNQAPVAVDDAASTLEGQPVNVDVLANDSDPDGDVLSVTNVSTPANGSVTVETDGTVTYTPAVGFSGSDSFTYDASDGVASDTATVTITVDPAPNQVPVAADDSASTTKGQPVNVDVLVNDSDPDGDVLSVTNLSTPANGSVVVEADGTVTYTPAAGFSGVDTFTYQASDGTDVSNVATVSVTVSNQAPVAVDDSASTTKGQPVSVDVLANDSDPDGDVLSVTNLSTPVNGSVVVEADGTVTYTPAAGFSGVDSFTYQASDGTDVSNVATVSVTVSNQAPVAVDDSASTTKGQAVNIDVLANDSDPESDALTVQISSIPSNGSVVVEPDETVTYTPAAGFSGVDTFTYQASDGNNPSNLATVSVTVSNQAPVAVDDSASTTKGQPVSVDVLANDSDPDGDVLSVTNLSTPVNGSVVVEADGTVTYTPAAGFSGVDTFTYQASDGTDVSNLASVSVTVSNQAPVAVDDSVSTTKGQAVNVDVLANDSDPDGDVLAVTNLSTPSNGSAVVEADGTVTYTPAAGFVGSDSFTYQASDGTDLSNVATVGIAIGETTVDQFAGSEDTLLGSVTGSLADTTATDDVYEQLTEEQTGGPRNRRVSRLEHRWTFDVERGDSITFELEARRTVNAEGDDFAFSYSTDGGASFEPLVVVAAGSDTTYQVDMPPTISGSIIVRVIDTDRTIGSGSTDSLFVDYMAVKTVNPQPPLPEVSVNATGPFAYEGGADGKFTISRSDVSSDLTVSYTVSGTATPGDDYGPLSGSVTLGAGQSTALVPVMAVDDTAAEGNESVVITLNADASYQIGFPSDASVIIVDDDQIVTDDDASSQSTIYGSVIAGDLSSTFADDGDYLVISEEAYGGGKRTRLEQRWTFSVTGGSSVTFFLQAHHSGAEDFQFAYSTDGGSSWLDMMRVTKTTDDGSYQTFALPSGVSGTVLVRATDADSSKFEPVIDSLWIDDFYFRSQP